MEHLLEEVGIRLQLRDERNPGHPVEVAFLGKLTEEQKTAADALLPHDIGVLSAGDGLRQDGSCRIRDRCS